MKGTVYFEDTQIQVELSGVVGNGRKRFKFKTWKVKAVQLKNGGRLQYEQHLKEGTVAGIHGRTQSFDHFFEGNVLMFVSFQCSLPGPCQYLIKVRVAGQTVP